MTYNSNFMSNTVVSKFAKFNSWPIEPRLLEYKENIVNLSDAKSLLENNKPNNAVMNAYIAILEDKLSDAEKIITYDIQLTRQIFEAILGDQEQPIFKAIQSNKKVRQLTESNIVRKALFVVNNEDHSFVIVLNISET